MTQMAQVFASIGTWLMLCHALGFAAAAPAQQSPARPSDPEPGNPEPRERWSERVKLAAIETLLGELDERFAAGDVQGYLAHFVADHPGSLAMLGLHLERQCASTASRQRKSVVMAGPRQIGGRSLVRVRHHIEWTVKNNVGRQPYVEDTYLALRAGANGRAVPTFAVEVPAATKCVEGDKFRCPACNYQIGGVDGWLCVPRGQAGSRALEAATFYLIGTGLACDVSVRVEAKIRTAMDVARHLAAAFREREASATVGIASPWVPCSHAANPPKGLDAARLVVELPEDHGDADGGLAIFHVVTFGGLQHLLLVRGSHKTVQQNQQHLDALFATYMLLEADCDLAKAAARPLRHHLGGVLEGQTYRNEHYDVELRGPAGWRPVQHVAGIAFRVSWAGPNGSRLWLSGHSVPKVMKAWTPAIADRWLQRECRQQKHGELEPTADSLASPEAQWHAAPGGGVHKTLILQARNPQSPAAPRRRLMYFRLHDDLLMIIDGYAGKTSDEEALRTAAKSLQRK